MVGPVNHTTRVAGTDLFRKREDDISILQVPFRNA